MMPQGLVVLLALLAAVCSAIGIVIRQRATMEVPADRGVSTAMLATLVRKRLWWAGTAAAVIGYACQALALTHGSLLLVQPLLVSSLLFALPISAWLADRRVTAGEWTWALVLTVALAVFVLVAQPRPGHYRSQPATWIAVTIIVVPLVLVCVTVAARTSGRQRAVLLAVAVAVLFGVVAVLTKITMHELADGGASAVLTIPAPYLLILLAALATLLQQSAFHAGALKMSVPTMLVLEPLVAVLLGAFVLGEHLALSGPASVAMPVVVVAMVAATIALGRDEGAYEEQLEAAVVRRS
ncbi:MAG TPA: DMT family transporter [Mycobacterium sp.]|nr:DMT family transporter [Mycobacterium sp.]HME48985.1 DMT family transporter [Mycobacterium sp.]